MKAKADTAIMLGLLIAVVVWALWPSPPPARDELAELRQQRRAIEAMLIEHLPDGYEDSLSRFADADTAAVWLPIVDPSQPGARPLWLGTVADLRALLKARGHLNRQNAFPEEDSP